MLVTICTILFSAMGPMYYSVAYYFTTAELGIGQCFHLECLFECNTIKSIEVEQRLSGRISWRW